MQDTRVAIDVTSNDSPYADRNSVSVIRDPHHGTAVEGEEGLIYYVPNKGHVGFDDFGYKVCAYGSCTTADVDLEIEPVIFTIDDQNSTAQVSIPQKGTNTWLTIAITGHPHRCIRSTERHWNTQHQDPDGSR